MTNDDTNTQAAATQVMRARGHDVLADMVDDVNQRHRNDGNECAACGPHPETWPCLRWLDTNDLVLRWLTGQLDTQQ